MVNLSDFIGQLTTSITRARVQADVEVIRVAEMYANHPLLKHFPVPRFRLPKVELDVPMIIEECPSTDSSTGKLTAATIKKHAAEAMQLQIEKHNVRMSQEQAKLLLKTIDSVADEAEGSSEVALDATSVTKKLSTELSKQLSKILRMKKADLTKVMSGFTCSLKTKLLSIRAASPSLKVITETAKIKEIGRDSELMRLRLTMDEDAVEWTVTDIDGEEVEKLVPE